MNFEQLRKLLVECIREKISNGEWTERSLARQSNISQPHLHNVLKGVRLLSPEMADRLLEITHMTILDLMEREKLGGVVRGD